MDEQKNEQKNEHIVSSIKWECGAHSQFKGNLYDTLAQSIGYAMTATQFFFGSPKSFKRHRASIEDIEKTKKLCERWPIHVFSHFPYVANLAGSSTLKTLAWDGDRVQDGKTQYILDELQYELSVMSNFNRKRNGVVIHPGTFPDRKNGLKTIAKSINKIDFVEDSKLLLENAAGKGHALATTFEEIKEIYDQVVPEKQKHIGVCVDTAHIFGYGSYDLSTCSEVKRMFKEFDDIIGLDKFTLLHLNDSLADLGTKNDLHALLGTGYIWGMSFESLILLLDMCKENGIPVVLETHGLDMLTLAQLSKSS